MTVSITTYGPQYGLWGKCVDMPFLNPSCVKIVESYSETWPSGWAKPMRYEFPEFPPTYSLAVR